MPAPAHDPGGVGVTWPTDEQAREAVIATARRIHDVMWTWTWPDDPHANAHSETEAIGIAKACLYLGEPVTDRVSSKYLVGLVERVARLEGAAAAEVSA